MEEKGALTKSGTGYNCGIDLLRILSMVLVVVLHVLGQGGVLAAAESVALKDQAMWFLETAAFCATDCFALISGYVGVTSKYRYSKIVLM